MNRSARRYDVECRTRDMDGGTAWGTMSRFLYTDGEERDWARVDGDWVRVDDKYGECFAFVAELPEDLRVEMAA